MNYQPFFDTLCLSSSQILLKICSPRHKSPDRRSLDNVFDIVTWYSARPSKCEQIAACKANISSLTNSLRNAGKLNCIHFWFSNFVITLWVWLLYTDHSHVVTATSDVSGSEAWRRLSQRRSRSGVTDSANVYSQAASRKRKQDWEFQAPTVVCRVCNGIFLNLL